MAPDAPEILIMPTLNGKYAVVERKYVQGKKQPQYTILVNPTTKQAAIQLRERMR